MSNRNYNSYNFLYDTDRGKQIIKQHRSYLNSDGVTEDTPTTQLFLDRVVDFEEKVTGTSLKLRHILSYVGQRRLEAKIPYRPEDPKLVEHVEQILAQPQVNCGDYLGERLIINGSA